MAWVPAAMAVVSTVMSIKGAQDAGKGAANSAAEDQASLDYQAAQDRVNAGQAMAVAERDAAEQRRQGDYAQSRAIALLAASGGGGVTDPGAVTLLANNAGEIAYRSAVALYKGEDEARALNIKANAEEFGGINVMQGGLDRQKAYNTQAFGDLLKGSSTLYDKYGSKGYAQQDAAPMTDNNTVYAGQ